MLSVVALLAVNGAVLKAPQPSSLKPILDLRGGLGGVDGDTVAKAVTAITGVNAGVMTLAPGKAAEMYGIVDPSPLVSWFCEVAGAQMLMGAIAAWLLLGGGDVSTAFAWGSVPALVQGVQMLLNGSTEKLGFGTMAQYMPIAVNAFFTAALFGKVGFCGPDLALKIFAGWGLFNGVAGYFATEPFMKGWEAPLNTDVEKAMAKFFCGVLACTSVMPAALAFKGATTLEAIAYSYGAFALTQADGLYISKTQDTIGADKNAGLFWLVVQVATVGFCLF
jgi:hypothetical protein